MISTSTIILFFKGLSWVSAATAAVSVLAWLRARWKLALIGALSITVAGTLWWKGVEVSRLENQITAYQNAINTLDDALENNRIEFDSCVKVNHANDQAIAEAHERADQADVRVREMASEIDSSIEVINDEVQELRGRDEDCRALGDPLPDWYDYWLRN